MQVYNVLSLEYNVNTMDIVDKHMTSYVHIWKIAEIAKNIGMLH